MSNYKIPGLWPPPSSIGSFAIGESPIGGPVYPPFQFFKTNISQYANSPVLSKLIQDMDAWINPDADFDAFFDLIWNVDTAVGYGLDVWGRIVGVGRVVKVITGSVFGFESQGSFGIGTFGEAPFFAGVPTTANYALPDPDYRTLILAKALSNISDGSIGSINQILLNLFPARGNAYVTEPGNSLAIPFGFAEGNINGDYLPFGQGPFNSGLLFGNMTMTYTFDFPLSPVEYAVVTQSGVLPKPTGVSASFVITG